MMARAAISDRRCADDDSDMTDVPGSLSLVFSTSSTPLLTAYIQADFLLSTEFFLGSIAIPISTSTSGDGGTRRHMIVVALVV